MPLVIIVKAMAILVLAGVQIVSALLGMCRAQKAATPAASWVRPKQLNGREMVLERNA